MAEKINYIVRGNVIDLSEYFRHIIRENNLNRALNTLLGENEDE